MLELDPKDLNPNDVQKKIDGNKEGILGMTARSVIIELTLYNPSSDIWVSIVCLREFMMMGNQVISTPTIRVNVYRTNIYMTLNDVTELVNIGNQINYYPVTVFVLDCVKLAMFTIYFGIDNIFQVY